MANAMLSVGQMLGLGLTEFGDSTGTLDLNHAAATTAQ
jgi:hypothetical protein